MSKSKSRARRVTAFALLLCALLAGALLWRARTAPPEAASTRSFDEPPRERRDPSVRPRRRSLAKTGEGTSPARCVRGAAVRCHQGDVWSFDSCGEREEKLEECEAQLCREDSCDPAPEEPCEDPPEGRCVGDTVQLCQAGRPRQVDCRAQGLRCVIGDEGAECAVDVPPALRCSGPARCDGDTLVRCEQGSTLRTDCRALRAECMTLPGAHAPSCIAVNPTPLSGLECGPCGCPPMPGRSESTCDGRDEDGDGLLDETLDCGPVPVIAFVVTEPAGQSSYAEEDVRAELERANRAFGESGVEGAPTFVLDALIPLADPMLLELDSDEVDRLADDSRVHPARDAFYVPVIFTDTLLAGGGTPKAGLSTLPNGTCGGMQEGHGPEIGVVAVAKQRAQTTVVHELGHFLGLCHTHEQQESASLAAVSDPVTGALKACRASCRGEGDGLCDTPFDPGPEQCRYDAECRTSCDLSAAPDATNLMSYYTGCRTRFSDEQVQLMQHTLALRRGWHACSGGRCACQFGARDCPAGMTCRPVELASGEAAARCGLDGPRPARADCEHMTDCGQGSLCVTDPQTARQRCARPCQSSAPGCDCQPAGEALNICVEDLGR